MGAVKLQGSSGGIVKAGALKAWDYYLGREPLVSRRGRVLPKMARQPKLHPSDDGPDLVPHRRVHSQIRPSGGRNSGVSQCPSKWLTRRDQSTVSRRFSTPRRGDRNRHCLVPLPHKGKPGLDRLFAVGLLRSQDGRPESVLGDVSRRKQVRLSGPVCGPLIEIHHSRILKTPGTIGVTPSTCKQT